MSNLFYRGGGAVSNLSILKEAKKNYMGRFIFSRGRGSICLFLCQKCTITSAATFNIMVITISLKKKYDFSNNMS